MSWKHLYGVKRDITQIFNANVSCCRNVSLLMAIASTFVSVGKWYIDGTVRVESVTLGAVSTTPFRTHIFMAKTH